MPWTFTGLIIGEGTLPVKCAEILLQRGHTLCGLISPTAQTIGWAEARRIPVLALPASARPSDEDLLAFLTRRPFDYLFSIVNSCVLPAAVLALPRRLAINYHDAPLPRYAGMYATSWAILQGQPRHGITWHVIVPQVDAGDILKQWPVEISADDTALTLNAKCYDAALAAFAELVDDLAYDRARPQPQNLEQRSYFSLYQPPPAGGALVWVQPAQSLAALVRALDFGPYPNPFGLPKLVLGAEGLILSKLEALEAPSVSAPGVLTQQDDALVVSTATNQVAIRQVRTLDGQPFPLSDVMARFGLSAGQSLEILSPERASRLAKAYSLLGRHEAFWVRRLAALQPLSRLYAGRTTPAAFGVPALLGGNALPGGDDPTGRLHLPPGRLYGAFVTYLARAGGVTCFDMGFKAPRPVDVTSLEGFFAEWVPLRLELDLSRPFAEVEAAVEGQLDAVRRHGTYARDVMARYPELASAPVPPTTWAAAIEEVETLNGYQAGGGSELTLVVARDGACRLVYDSAVFDEAARRRVHQSFGAWQRGLASGGSEPVQTLPLVTEAERRLLAKWQGAVVKSRSAQCVHELFEEQAARTPSAIAVQWEGALLTYQALNERANQLARHLQTLSVGPEALVGLCIERSPEMIVAMLGSLKAGGAYVPIDPLWPEDRKAFVLTDTQAQVVVTQGHLSAGLSAEAVSRVCLDTDWPRVAEAEAENLERTATFENLAYVIYTSGTTGKPKGVMIAHGALANFTAWAAQAYQLSPADRVLQFASPSFDAAVEEIYPCLTHGGVLVLRTEAMLATAETFWEKCRQWQVTVADLPTAYWHELVRAFASGPDGTWALPERLRLVIVGGERVSPDEVRRWQARVGDKARLVNTYGPTEATVVATQSDLTRWRDEGGEAPIGRPIDNVETYILDRAMQLMPVGGVGELHIGGRGLAQGYWRRPDLTAEKFVARAWGAEPARRLYKSGDLARYRSDGQLEFLGRLDSQVKIRGYRIELTEIETVLLHHPNVQAAVVTTREDSRREKQLAAYVVFKDRAPYSTSDLRGDLAKELPDYMLPSMVVALDALPLNSSGKVDRRALPAPDLAGLLRPETYAAPGTPLEEMLASLWAEVLGVARVGRCDSFFDLGGHSLRAIQIISRLHETLQVKLPLHSLLDKNATVASVAQLIETLRWTNEAPRGTSAGREEGTL